MDTTVGTIIADNAKFVETQIRGGLDNYNHSHNTQISIREGSTSVDYRDGCINFGLANVGVLTIYDTLEQALRASVGPSNLVQLGERRYNSDIVPTKYVLVVPGREIQRQMADAERLEAEAKQKREEGKDIAADDDDVKKKTDGSTSSRCRILLLLLFVVLMAALVGVLGFGLVLNTLSGGGVSNTPSFIKGEL